ncbi:MAG: hydroxyisourate hydrolase [Geodermatophilaceae bacterium]|jgi:5-hydroxyisourate hydrolase|nr:hydroxyisourate hydrolase [Geodermatophilaceae bacterium]MDQ3474878.1 hydroxyisourate hydrolase [Actinomycetota bacterium]MDQ3715566.1 hydroxyisourate hydrolase [Actinomycetota bacterium]
MSVTTHVLDTARGLPALGVNVLLTDPTGDTVAAITDLDGRARLAEAPLLAGNYQLVFATAEYFAATRTPTFYPEVAVTFTVTDGGAHHHVPLLISPYAYSTYRGT